MQVKLKVLVGKSAGKEVPVPVSRFLIGRAKDCHMRPKSDSISRNHCAILTTEDQVVVRDLNSRNGTLVNGTKLEADHVLENGDRVRVGKLEFEMVILPSEPASKSKAAPSDSLAKKATGKNKKAAAKKDPAKDDPAKDDPAVEKRPVDGTPAVVENETTVERDVVGEQKEESIRNPDTGSIDFDVSEWLQEADSVEKARRQSEPETRQFQLDETDRIQLEGGGEEPPEEADADAKQDEPHPPAKKEPGKLPERPKTQAATSRDAAADMLKKFFNNR